MDMPQELRVSRIAPGEYLDSGPLQTLQLFLGIETATGGDQGGCRPDVKARSQKLSFRGRPGHAEFAESIQQRLQPHRTDTADTVERNPVGELGVGGLHRQRG